MRKDEVTFIINMLLQESQVAVLQIQKDVTFAGYMSDLTLLACMPETEKVKAKNCTLEPNNRVISKVTFSRLVEPILGLGISSEYYHDGRL